MDRIRRAPHLVHRVRRAWVPWIVALTATVSLSACPAGGGNPAPAEPPAATTGVRVVGNQLRDGADKPVRLLGFNHAGTEYMCVEGAGVFDTEDGAAPSESVLRAMRGWRGANAVRVPLNEQCWLGVGGVPARYSGQAYRDAVRTFVTRLNRNGFVAVLDLHRTAPGDATSREQEQMPDRDHSPAFWTSLAGAYKNDPGVVFDLFNEPNPFDEENTARAWACWRDGGCQLTSINSGEPYLAAGMNELIAAVRGTGARNVVLAGGIFSAEVMTQWLAYRPTDPLGQLGASFHAYSFNEYCSDTTCYDRDLAPIARAVPLFVGEVGPNLDRSSDGIDEKCPASAVGRGDFTKSTFDWLDEHGASYTPWSWNPWPDCWALVTGWDGDPTGTWGKEVKSRLAAAN